MLLQLADRAYDIFIGSEVGKVGKKIYWEMILPFDVIANSGNRIKWHPFVDIFCNGNIEMDITLQRIQTTFSLLSIDFSV